MTDINASTKAYLDDYFSKSSPGFAVLVEAPWGAGKTHFIKSYLQRRASTSKGPVDYLYVSLFGVQSPQDINRAIGLARYNVEDAQILERAGAAVTGAVKHWTGVDLSWRIEDVARIGLPQYLVFDDIERTSQKADEVLGAVHTFVEHEKKHVVLIGNQDKFFATDEAREIKEKTIGITLSIEPDFEAALPEILEGLLPDGKDFLRTQAELIRHTFETAAHKNLRSLAQVLWDFDRILREMTADQRDNSVGLAALLRDYLILALEYKAGVIDGDVLKARNNIYSGLNGDKEISEPLRKIKEVAAKHSHHDLRFGLPVIHGPALPTDLAHDVIVRGAVTNALVQSQLQLTSAFQTPQSEPPWRTLWWAALRTRLEVEKAYACVMKQLSEGSLTDPWIVLHIFSSLIELRTPQVEARSIPELEQAAEAYFGSMSDDDVLKADANVWLEVGEWQYPPRDYHGLGYPLGNDERSQAFLRIWKSFVAFRSEAMERQLKSDAAGLVQTLESDPDSLILDLMSNNRKAPKWGLAPILAYIPVDDFVGLALRAQSDKRRTILSILKDRLKIVRHELVPEHKWLKDVEQCLREKWQDLDDFEKWQNESFLESIATLVKDVETE